MAKKILVFYGDQPCLEIKPDDLDGTPMGICRTRNRNKGSLQSIIISEAKKVKITPRLKEILLEDIAFAFGYDTKLFNEKLAEFGLVLKSKKVAKTEVKDEQVKPIKVPAKTMADFNGKDFYLLNGFGDNILSSIELANPHLYNFKFRTEEIALATQALIQLEWFINDWNGDWKPNWLNDVDKHCIIIVKGEPTRQLSILNQKFLAFKTRDLAETFLVEFKPLILVAKPLL